MRLTARFQVLSTVCLSMLPCTLLMDVFACTGQHDALINQFILLCLVHAPDGIAAGISLFEQELKRQTTTVPYPAERGARDDRDSN